MSDISVPPIRTSKDGAPVTSRLGFRGLARPLFGASAKAASEATALPRALDSYTEGSQASLWEILQHRIAAEPFNLVASLIFLLAIWHTFLTARFRQWAHVAEERHAAKMAQRPTERSDS